jgi:uncharacterized protein (DUF433 family)
MTRDELLDRILIDPAVCFGRPCVKGRRVWVSHVLDLLTSGAPIESIVEEYGLAEDDVRACIAYGTEMARYVDLTIDDLPPSAAPATGRNQEAQ